MIPAWRKAMPVRFRNGGRDRSIGQQEASLQMLGREIVQEKATRHSTLMTESTEMSPGNTGKIISDPID